MGFEKCFAFAVLALMLALPSMAYAIPTEVDGCPGYTVLGINQSMTSGAYSLRLSDVPVTTGMGNTYPAILDIFHNGEAVIQLQGFPNSTYTFTLPDENNPHLVVSVCRVAAAFTPENKWAAVSWSFSNGSNQPPVISGGVMATLPVAGLAIGQTGTWTVFATDPENDTLTYSANWDDGSSSAVQWRNNTIFHAYFQAGTYTIVFTATDPEGASAQATKQVTVINPPNQPPVISGGTAPTTLTVGQLGVWEVFGSDPENEPLTLSANWGDGSSDSAHVTHIYSQAGTYTIVFTATDPEGASAHTTMPVLVVPGQQSNVTVISNVSVTPPIPEDGTLVFHKGWNMVSTVSSEVLMEDVAKVCGTRSYAWSYSQQSGYLKPTSLTPGIGYWVLASRDCTYKIPRRVILVDGMFFQLSQGWNLFSGPSSAVKVSDFSSDCKITSGPWIYNPVEGKYDYSDTIEPNKAYWIKSATSCSPLSGEKPPLPPS